MRGRLLAYGWYQLVDYLTFRAALPFTLIGLLLFNNWFGPERRFGHVFWTTPAGGRQAQLLYSNALTLFLIAGGFLGIARIISDERANGYYRFFFSKPVSLTRFYVQRWMIHGIGFTVATALIAALVGRATVPTDVMAASFDAMLFWILIGGIGFLCGALTNSDAVVLLFVLIGSAVVHDAASGSSERAVSAVRWLLRLVPPTDKLSNLHNLLKAGSPVNWPDAWFVAGYGFAALLAGIVVLRRTSFAR